MTRSASARARRVGAEPVARPASMSAIWTRLTPAPGRTGRAHGARARPSTAWRCRSGSRRRRRERAPRAGLDALADGERILEVDEVVLGGGRCGPATPNRRRRRGSCRGCVRAASRRRGRADARAHRPSRVRWRDGRSMRTAMPAPTRNNGGKSHGNGAAEGPHTAISSAPSTTPCCCAARGPATPWPTTVPSSTAWSAGANRHRRVHRRRARCDVLLDLMFTELRMPSVKAVWP